MTYAPTPSGIVNVLAGLALVALGAYLLRLRFRSVAGVAFCAFAITWGLQIAAANAYDMTLDPATGRLWLHAFLFLLVPLYVPLLYFVSAYPSPSNALARSPVAIGIAAAPAVVLMLLFATWPDVLVRDVRAVTGGLLTVPGPLYWPVTVWNSMVAFAVALALVLRHLARAREDVPRRQLALLAAALFAYVSYRASDVLLAALVAESLAADAGWNPVAVYAAGGSAVAGVAAWGLRRVARMPDVPWRSLILACGTVPLVVGLLEVVLRVHLGVAGFRTAGLWRFVLVGILAYAIAKYRLFDLDVRLRRSRLPFTYVALVVFAGGLLWGLFASPLAASPGFAVAASGGLAVMCYPLARAVQGRVDRSVPASPDTEYVYRRKLEVYAAALDELRTARSGAPDEERFLAALRLRLDVTEDEHRFLVALLRARTPPGPAKSGTSARFHVLRELGRGAAGRALLARDVVLDRDVVLKQPLVGGVRGVETRERVLREARLAAKVSHPNVVSVFEVLADDDPPVLVLEFVDGGSLQDVLAAEGRAPPAFAVRVALDVLAGLDALHARGIVHRDLKPANVLVDASGTAKITDFGIARDERPDPGAYATRSSPSFQPGTPAFMSPEQLRGGDVGPPSDLYAVGVLLYRCLAGHHYLDLEGCSKEETRERVLHAPPLDPPPGTVPPPVAVVIHRALAKSPEDRFASAAEMAVALRSAAGPWADGAGVAVPVRRPDATAVAPTIVEGAPEDGDA